MRRRELSRCKLLLVESYGNEEGSHIVLIKEGLDRYNIEGNREMITRRRVGNWRRFEIVTK